MTEIGVSVFFVIVALATALLVYNGITHDGKKKTQETKEEKGIELPKLK